MNHALSIAPHVSPDWAILAAQSLGDGCFALTLQCGELDATAVVWWKRIGPRDDQLVVDACTDEHARRWLQTTGGDRDAARACWSAS